jgi:hypothetical protein
MGGSLMGLKHKTDEQRKYELNLDGTRAGYQLNTTHLRFITNMGESSILSLFWNQLDRWRCVYSYGKRQCFCVARPAPPLSAGGPVMIDTHTRDHTQGNLLVRSVRKVT